jgi:putative inorganic carbon (HCO3(-)) transporter
MARHSFGRSKYKLKKWLSEYSGRIFIQEKLNNWLGYLLILGVACLYALILSYNILMGLSVFAVLFGLFIVMICLANVEAGVYLLLFLSFFSYFISSFFFKSKMPVGAVFDTVVVINFLGLVFSRKDFKQSWRQFIRIPLIVYILLRFFFDVVEMFNPNSMGASLTSLQGVRKFFEYALILFTVYTLFDSYQRIRKFTFGLLAVAVISALYGCIQEWHGLFDFELQPILADPHAMGLLFENGEFRKFSTMSDPSSFGIVMAVCALFFLILSLNEKKPFYRFLFIGGSVLMLLGMGYSGTRTAYATEVAGITFFILLNIDKPSVQKFGIVCVLTFLALQFGPFSSNSTIRRFRTTFAGTKDESFKVRIISRQFIQPYIRSHPIGGGLGTTGFNGAVEHPGHYLANFQPDSSYVTKAAETGWIGFGLILILYFWTLKVAIHGFFRAKDPKIKIYYSACESSLFAFYIAEFAQVAIGGVSDVVVYFSLVAIILKIKYYEDAQPNHPTKLDRGHSPAFDFIGGPQRFTAV